MKAPLIEVDGLEIEYQVRGARARALDGASLTVGHGEVIGIVGESGSGKTTLGMAVGRLLPTTAKRTAGDLRIDGQSVFEYGHEDILRLRRDRLGFVFQNPMTALDPTRVIRDQLSDVVQSKRPEAVSSRLEMVGLPNPKRVAASYPHQLSGGMAQRVAIAIAIARNPKVIVADEPTASLDASIRTQILDLLIGLSRDLGASVLLLSHDLRAMARYCQTVAVMYGGRVVETGQTDAVFTSPSHPYTEALLLAAPGVEDPDAWLQPIPGMQPVLSERQERCPFAPRCRWAVDACFTIRPEIQVVDGRRVICHRAPEVLRGSESSMAPARGEEATRR